MNNGKYVMRDNLRFITATSLFDGHDATINIIRRLLQDAGVEVIHLAHNRGVPEIVDAAVQECAHAIALSSYQGGHMETFKYLVDLLKEMDCAHIKVFGGGGGVIIPEEMRELEAYGVTKIYSPEDGRRMGLKGMIGHMVSIARKVKIPKVRDGLFGLKQRDPVVIGRIISLVESGHGGFQGDLLELGQEIKQLASSVNIPVVGITGTGGSGKSSLIDEIVRRFLYYYPEKTLAIVSVDPTRRKSGGALLGDRVRMNYINNKRVYMRSMATRDAQVEIPLCINDVLAVLKASGFNLILLETSGIGQGDAAVTQVSDVSMYVMTSEYGAPSQLEKIDMLDFADIVVLNKFDHERSMDALRDVRKQYRRNHAMFDASDHDLPIFATVASRYNDKGTSTLFRYLMGLLKQRALSDLDLPDIPTESSSVVTESIIPKGRGHYLREIADAVRAYHRHTEKVMDVLERSKAIEIALNEVEDSSLKKELKKKFDELQQGLGKEDTSILNHWQRERKRFSKDVYTYQVRGIKNRVELRRKSLSGLDIPKVALPEFRSDVETYRWLRKENLPGRFPYTAGVFPFRREWEEPRRQFAGEGTPERTNKRFHYLTRYDEAKRLSTAFDSLTLYGEDPDERPDIFGKIGESGVSVCTLDDMKRLYAGFDLCSPLTSVSMTINGPAPIITAMFFNAAIDQQISRFRDEHGRMPGESELMDIRSTVLSTVRGTVQADILKEDQGQNSCIFSTDFALRMMKDMQEFFIDNNVNNFYSISISGYHIAEAGAFPITQLAFTLANGFTYVEYYRSRGLDVDDFAKNFSFFFSSGMEPEYSVILRVARRIWAIGMRDVYKAGERAQKLKCHVQTSGRSLHSMEIDFNDIRTTLQAFMALSDRCNSLHTNAYDEAITTPTEESVRRAVAIQLILNREFGLLKNENPNQGSFIIEWLTDAVEEAVLEEFEKLSDRGGVLGAMEAQYQRSKIQEESLYYERLKHSGEYPIVGVNTFERSGSDVGEDVEGTGIPITRATVQEKMQQLENLKAFKTRNKNRVPEALKRLQDVAVSGDNIFKELMETVKVASLGQITSALYDIGGKYRRNI